MREQIEQRLTVLNEEREAGARMLADLEERRAELQHTLLRLDGAMHVLRELLESDDAPWDTDPDERAPDEAGAAA